jgi:hypothetical protein
MSKETQSWSGIPELRASYKKLGGPRFWTIMAGTLIYIGLGTGLMISAQWPASCQPEGHDLFGAFYCSPQLLSGGPLEIGTFAWSWSMPSFVIFVALWTRLKHGKWGWQMRAPEKD